MIDILQQSFCVSFASPTKDTWNIWKQLLIRFVVVVVAVVVG
jgi:hypothetical protein